ncbi:MAG: hypothetical protein JST00_27400 [Deltaproteobacteria bacterium]|nr:hypothetical protein [Deltaproteobacteria bacterium]
MSPRRGLATLVAAPLALGAVTYLLLRPGEAWFVRLLGDGALGAPLHRLRAATVPIGARVPSVLLGVAPDLAWALAAGALLGLVWRDRRGAAARAWYALGLAAALGFEVAQRFHLVPGTFDPRDLVALTVGYVAGWWLATRATHPVRASASP